MYIELLMLLYIELALAGIFVFAFLAWVKVRTLVRVLEREPDRRPQRQEQTQQAQSPGMPTMEDPIPAPD